MKNSILLNMALVAVLATSFIFMDTTSSTREQTTSETPVVRFEPEFLTVNVGLEFTVTARVENVSNLYGIDVQLAWDTEYLLYLNHQVYITKDTYPDGILYTPGMFVTNVVDPVAGTYSVAYACMDPAPQFNGSGNIFAITFRVSENTRMEVFNTTLDLTSTDLSNKQGTPIPHARYDCTVEISLYNPWCDLNDDGIINIYDVVMVTGRYGSTGVPLNKTALLYNVNNTFTQLLDRIDILESDRTLLFSLYWQLHNLYGDLQANQTQIFNELDLLQTLYDGLEANQTQIYIELGLLQGLCDDLEENKLGEPDYDSGWEFISRGTSEEFPHNQGTTNVLVYIVGYNPSASPYIHQINYGGETTGSGLLHYGAYWHDLTTTSLYVTRNYNSDVWQYVRVMIWKIPES